jgi:ABC-type uncharacterized transport system substrate-binding protein
MPVIGFLRTAAAAGSAHIVSAFRQGLNEAGFVEGQNIAVEYRWADDQPDRVPGMAADLVRRPVAVIVTNGIAVPAVKAATATIPIIFLTGYDPVRIGFVTSLNRPGGNLTGVVFTVTDLVTKQVGPKSRSHCDDPLDCTIAAGGYDFSGRNRDYRCVG